MAQIAKRVGVLQWVVVLVVGIVVVAIVLGLNLIGRLSDGQKVLDGARPAFTSERVAADRAGIDAINKIVNLSDPIVTPRGGGAGEVPTVVSFVAQRDHITEAQALTLLQKDYPHTTALLQAIPLSAVTAELPRLQTFLASTLKLTPAQLGTALKTNFPALNQAITNLPAVTNGWEGVPRINGLTRFDGTPVKSVPQVRSYFSADLIPVLERERSDFNSLDETSVSWIPWLLLIVGLVVIVFATVMILRNLRGRVSPREAVASAIVVPVVGVVVVALVLVISLVPRLSNGQKLLDGLRPANTPERVQGDRAAINTVSTIVDTLDPIMTDKGGAAAEVPKLIAFVAKKTRLSQATVLTILQSNFPHTTALLQAIPISSVSAELPGLVGFLSPAVIEKIPHLLPTILNAQAVTSGWDNVPGTAGATRFTGAPVKTVPDVRTYFSRDVIPVLETQRANYASLVATSEIGFLGPLVLIIGIVVIVFGLLMVLLALRGRPREATEASAPTAAPTPAA